MSDLTNRRGRNVFYNSAPWSKFRAWYLALHPLCAECERRGFWIPAVHVDHIEPLAKAPERPLDETNVQGLCKSCHSAKTRAEATGGTASHWSDGACGIDGLPLSPQHPWNRDRE